MKKEILTTILSFLASLCFFIVFMIHKEIINFILSCTWFIIGNINMKNIKKGTKK